MKTTQAQSTSTLYSKRVCRNSPLTLQPMRSQQQHKKLARYCRRLFWTKNCCKKSNFGVNEWRRRQRPRMN